MPFRSKMCNIIKNFSGGVNGGVYCAYFRIIYTTRGTADKIGVDNHHVNDIEHGIVSGAFLRYRSDQLLLLCIIMKR